MATVSASASPIIATGYWDTQTGDPATAPGNGKYQADSWAAPALIAVAGQDANGYDRSAGLAAIQPGDLITELATNDSQNYQRWNVVAVTDHGTWAQIAVEVVETGSAFVTPGMNQRRLLEALSLSPAPAGEPWVAWAPPLDPPTAGGLPLAQAQAIADATWSSDPHLCAALQWESYAATLPPSPSVSNVSTGAQSVAYSPASPTGDYGAALARAAWHRSLMGGDRSVELVLALPALVSAPGNPWNAGDDSGWWEIA